MLSYLLRTGFGMSKSRISEVRITEMLPPAHALCDEFNRWELQSLFASSRASQGASVFGWRMVTERDYGRSRAGFLQAG